ncbi:hypothetical protein GCM10029964_092190 [Kibdelosporangium lantanae]
MLITLEVTFGFAVKSKSATTTSTWSATSRQAGFARSTAAPQTHKVSAGPRLVFYVDTHHGPTGVDHVTVTAAT